MTWKEATIYYYDVDQQQTSVSSFRQKEVRALQRLNKKLPPNLMFASQQGKTVRINEERLRYLKARVLIGLPAIKDHISFIAKSTLTSKTILTYRKRQNLPVHSHKYCDRKTYRTLHYAFTDRLSLWVQSLTDRPRKHYLLTPNPLNEFIFEERLRNTHKNISLVGLRHDKWQEQ